MDFGVGRWWRFVILVWIGCGSAVVVCDYGLDRRWRFVDFDLDRRGGFALV